MFPSDDQLLPILLLWAKMLFGPQVSPLCNVLYQQMVIIDLYIHLYIYAHRLIKIQFLDASVISCSAKLTQSVNIFHQQLTLTYYTDS